MSADTLLLERILSHMIYTVFPWSQNAKSAAEFYEAKTKELGTNIQGLEAIIQGKTNNLRVVEEGRIPSHSPPGDVAICPAALRLHI